MTKIKVSDYVSQFLVNNRIRDLFSIYGGGIMNLLDSCSKQEELSWELCQINRNECKYNESTN